MVPEDTYPFLPRILAGWADGRSLIPMLEEKGWYLEAVQVAFSGPLKAQRRERVALGEKAKFGLKRPYRLKYGVRPSIGVARWNMSRHCQVRERVNAGKRTGWGRGLKLL
jgi:hypothetical protein